ncbi:S1 family peptidase [Chondromyces crocatus]|uniref:Peptidase S1 domain-containing protein n=1 Tax=Chondromyces crocatus TaxID=52 RepID=A0A0K1EIV9_CHOCO|nr:trypsin-like serine protease [Chondromyces crocatus]AKT40800.1 uncharacterized protein CMC5_049560 [Chondromyces crocatus]
MKHRTPAQREASHGGRRRLAGTRLPAASALRPAALSAALLGVPFAAGCALDATEAGASTAGLLGATEAGASTTGLLDAERLAEGRAWITDGTLTLGDPAVVGLVRGGKIGCTGVVVSPQLVLTAAHCVVNALPDALLVGSALNEGEQVDLVRSFLHPRYRLGEAAHDLGALVLRAPLEVAPIPLNAAALVTADEGQRLRIVGFGQVAGDDPLPAQKREGSSTIGTIASSTFRVEPDPAQPCSGDSGGPALATRAGAEVLLGIISSGDGACSAGSEAVRVDAHRETFLAPLLTLVEGTSRELGQRCVVDRNCASGLCLAPDDAPSFAFCTQACTEEEACGEGMRCGDLGASTPAEGAGDRDLPEGKVCRFAGPSPGAIGSACGSDDACEFGLCAAFDESASLVCSALCFPGDPQRCGPDATCSPLADRDGVFGCARLDDDGEDAPFVATGGCALGGARSGAGSCRAGLMLGLVCAMAWRRRAGQRKPGCQSP